MRTTFVFFGLALLIGAMLPLAVCAEQPYVDKDGTLVFPFGITDADMAICDRMPDLKAIMFGGNEAYSGPGPIPPFEITDRGFAHIANCKRLEKLICVSGHPLRLTDAAIAHLSGLANLEELWLDDIREIGDGSLKAVSGLKKLRVLRLYRCMKVTDAGIKQLAGLSELEELQLGDTKIGDESLKVIGKFSKMKLLDLQGTGVTDEGLALLKSLRLHWLCLKGDNVTSAGMTAIDGMTGLEYLFIPGTGADDATLDAVARMTKLKSLDLEATQVTDAGIAKLRACQKLEHIVLDKLPLTDKTVDSLLAMKGLKNFQANLTQISSAGFKRLADAGLDRWNIYPTPTAGAANAAGR